MDPRPRWEAGLRARRRAPVALAPRKPGALPWCPRLRRSGAVELLAVVVASERDELAHLVEPALHSLADAVGQRLDGGVGALPAGGVVRREERADSGVVVAAAHQLVDDAELEVVAPAL